ncbi:MAG TPA: hypothetical protein PK992_05495 [Planctomycetaceae bacterium]|nr:hypothetical protein [Planctomycetaceae bacterium]HRA87497.1 hypothetical protein [Planctomycetaceae bacterium]
MKNTLGVRSIANAVTTECVEDRRDWNPGKNATEKPRNHTGFVCFHEDILIEFTADSSLLDQ